MMATFVGVFQGAIQALSRSYYAKIIPKEKSTEYFGIFDIFGKGAFNMREALAKKILILGILYYKFLKSID